MEIEEVERKFRTSRTTSFTMWDEKKYKSWVVPLFVVVSFVVFIVTMYTNNCPFHHHNHGDDRPCVMRFLGKFSFEPFRQNPLLGPSSQTLLKMGAADGATVAHYHQGWRLFTSIWLHIGLLHLLVNLLSLLIIGIRLEQQFGFARTTAIYLLAGIGGNMVSCLFVPNHVSIGASSALLGLIGAMFSELLTNWTIYTNKLTAAFTLMVNLIINIVVVVVPRHSGFGPLLGGFLIGFLVGFVLLPRPIGWLTRQNIGLSVADQSKYKTYQYILGIISLILLIIGYIMGLVMLFHGEKTP